MSREEVHEALFKFLRTAAPFATVSRTFKHYKEVPFEEQPAMFQVAGNDTSIAIADDYGAGVHKQSFEIIIYAFTPPDNNVPPSAVLNPLLDAVLEKLESHNGQKQTLDGLVEWVVLDTTAPILIEDGAFGGQSFAVIPVTVAW